MDKYTDSIIKSITEWGGKTNRPINTIYFGGGTPSLLGKRLNDVMHAVNNSFKVDNNAEITLEINPTGDIEEILSSCKRSGVNRLSIGVQSGNDNELLLLGRTHKKCDVVNVINRSREYEFNNISLDLMLGLPDSNIDTLRNSLEFFIGLKPEHISSYILKIEENTRFYHDKDLLNFPDDDAQADQYLFMCNYLEKAGYNHYEISNFSLAGKESRHNLKYWNCEEYIGIGPSAHSFLCGERFFYNRDVRGFIMGNTSVSEGKGGDLGEYVMLRLRLKDGIIYNEIENKYNISISDNMIDVAKEYQKLGLMDITKSGFSLTDKGMLVSNVIINDLLECI